MPEDLRKFQIGQVVRVEDIAKRVSRSNGDIYWTKHNLWVSQHGRSWDRAVEPFNGVIVGATRRQEGKMFVGNGYDEPPHLEQTGTVLLWKVTTTYLGKPVLVFEESIMPVSLVDFRLPWHPASRQWTEAERVDHANEMRRIYQEHTELFPRDEKGRFRKTNAF